MATAGARRFLDDEDEPGNEKGWWHESSGTTLPGAQSAYHNSDPLDYSRPYVGAVHPYASAVPTLNRIAPPVDHYPNHQAPSQTHTSYDSPPTASGSTINTQLPPSTAGHDIDHVPRPPGQSTPLPPVRTRDSSAGSTHPYASLQSHTVYELFAEDVLAQQSPHHEPPVQYSSIDTAARGYSPGHLTTSTPVMHISPAATASDLFASGSRSGSAEKEQWYDDTDSESHTENRKSGLVSFPPSGEQDFAERAKYRGHGPRFSGVFGPSTAWAPTHHQPRNSVDAGTVCEEHQGQFDGNGRVLTVANA